jgi:cytochrome c peroxidase
MNQDLAELERELNAVPGYAKQFEAVFGTKVTREGIAKALAAYERTLVTKPSPYDRYLAGEKDALSEQAREGLRLFEGDGGCVRCHRGVLLSDGKFYRLGVESRDQGLAGVTRKKEDRGKFRTPSLRNVAETGPYMHDGSLKTLDEVVTFYYRGVPVAHPDGLPLDVEPLLGQSFSEIPAIVAFLKSLSGEAPRASPPKLP